MIKADIHTHSYYSTDSDTPLRTMVETALQKGLDIYCVTEHMDWQHHIYNARTAPGYSYGDMTRQEVEKLFVCDTDSFSRELLSLKDEYAGRIKLLLGMELGIQPDLGSHYREYVSGYPFDFLIGSGHEAGGFDPYYPLLFESFSSTQSAIQFYFEQMLEAARECIDSFDSLGHPDYVLRYHRPEGFVFSYDDYRDILDELLLLLVRNEKALECNTGSFKYFRDCPQPIEEILIRYRRLGGRYVTVGSDAHAPERIAADFDTAASFLRRAGFDRITVFENRTPSLLDF